MIDMRAFNSNGILDQNITPLNMIFRVNKLPNGSAKIISMTPIAMGGQQEIYTIAWSGNAQLDDEDKDALNKHLMNYFEIFSNLNENDEQN